MAGNLRITDRLRDRGFIDQWGFVAFAFAGSAAIIAAKAFSIPGNWVAAGAVSAMAAYAVIIMRGGTGRLRADQAGDNCYYLGLIYTLASLSYAIATFDPSDAASTIVQGFGVALATTIVGLILRVFFNQGRPDLENVEEQTRMEMTDAVARLKAQLGDCVRQLNDFTRGVQQSMTELHESATESIQNFTENSVSGLSEVVEAASSTIREEANDFAARSKRYSTTFDKLLAKLDRHADSVEELTVTQSSMQRTLESAAEAASSATAAVGALRESAESARSTSTATRESVESVKVLALELARSVEKMQLSLHEMQTQSSRHLDEMRTGPSKVVSEVVGALSLAADELKSHVSSTSDLHAEAHAGITAQSKAALEATRRHNEQIEAELDRSRQLVGKVHHALTDMTARLVDVVERPA